VVVLPCRAPRGLLVIGHGAGGGLDAPDIVAARDAAMAEEWTVAGVVQPYRLLGRRAPAPPAQLDAAFLAVVGSVRQRRLRTVPLVVAGRSSGARVACRTARGCAAAAVVALAFPLHPPGRPERSRADELAAGVPVHVVQGERDAFGSPAEVTAVGAPDVDVVVVPAADHSLRTATARAVVTETVTTLLQGLE
jgi:uncharacterized protein